MTYLIADDMYDEDARAREEKKTEEKKRYLRAVKRVLHRMDEKHFFVDLTDLNSRFVSEPNSFLFNFLALLLGEDSFVTYEPILKNTELYSGSMKSLLLEDFVPGTTTVRKYNMFLRDPFSLVNQIYSGILTGDIDLYDTTMVQNTRKSLNQLCHILLFHAADQIEFPFDFSRPLKELIKLELSYYQNHKGVGCAELFYINVFHSPHFVESDPYLNIELDSSGKNLFLYDVRTMIEKRKFSRLELNEENFYSAPGEIPLWDCGLRMEDLIFLLSNGLFYLSDIIENYDLFYKYYHIEQASSFLTDMVEQLNCLPQLLSQTKPFLRISVSGEMIDELGDMTIVNYKSLKSMSFSSLENQLAKDEICEKIENAVSLGSGKITWSFIGSNTPWYEAQDSTRHEKIIYGSTKEDREKIRRWNMM